MAEQVLRAESTLRALHGAFCRGASRDELLQLAAAKIIETGPPYGRAHMYLLVRDALRLHASAGQELDSDAVDANSGVVERAVGQKMNVYVPDTTSDGCATHSTATRSKLVVLIRRHDEILGAIDLESGVPDGFGDREQTSVREVADGLAALL